MHIKNILILFTILGGLFMGNSLYAKPPIFLHNYKEAVEICKDLKQPMILIFSAEWCGPCKKLKQDISKYSDKFKDTTIVILDITKNAKIQRLLDFLILALCCFLCNLFNADISILPTFSYIDIN